MGVVYRAYDVRLDRAVALKVLSPQLAADPSFQERFERESRLAASIDHPNVVPIYQAGEADGRLFIAMRWVDGSDLGDVIRHDGPLPAERVVALLEQVAAALDAAHERGLVHRDVKPGNVLVAGRPATWKGEHAYLTDFGIAKTSASTQLTRTGLFLGTPDYAAPEQFEGRELDRRVDVYALGCLLYHCLSGKRPFERTDDLAVMYAHVQEAPPRISEVRDDVPAALDAVVATGMAKSREDRYPTCGDLAVAARATLERPAAPAGAQTGEAASPSSLEETVVSTPPGAPQPVIVDVAATVPAAVPLETRASAAPAATAPAGAASTPRRHRSAWVAAAVVAVGVLVALAAILWLGGDEQSSPASGGAAKPAPTPWTRLEAAAFGGEGRQVVNRLAATAAGTVTAVGTTGNADAPDGLRERDAVVWRVTGLPDAATVTDTRLEAGGDQIPYGVTAIDEDRFLVVGYGRSQLSEPGDALVVRSDGFELDLVDLAGPGYEKMNRVTRSGEAIVAVGATGPGRTDAGVPRATDAAVWRSRDAGATWERVSEATFTKPGYQEIRSVAFYPQGLVGVGYAQAAGAVWLSDGVVWRRVAADSPALEVTASRPSSDLLDVQPLGTGLVAVGTVRTAAGDQDGAVWTSTDGETWSLVEDAGFGGPADQRLLGVATGEFGAVAVGCTGCGTPEAAPVVWTSKDGRSWALVPEDEMPPADGPEELTSVTVAGTLVVAGGTRDGDATVWTAPLPG
jgi:hypothetical protein